MALEDQPTGGSPSNPADHRSEADVSLDRRVQHDHLWWRKPHPVWILLIMFIFAFNLNVTSPVRPGVLIDLACIVRNTPVGGVAQPTIALPDTPGATAWQIGQISVFLARAAIPTADMTAASHTPSPFPGITEECKRDVAVQKLTAQIQMGITIVSGILSILVVGPWTSRSDRVGRKPVLAGVALGIFLNEALFLCIVLWPEVLLHTGISIFFVGAIIEGILGAAPVLSAVSSAYITDTASATSRFAYFAAVNGFLMAGSMVGPLLGSLLIRLSNNALMPFKVSLVGHSVIIALLLLAVPESLSTTGRQHHQKKYDAVQRSVLSRTAAEQEDFESDTARGESSWLASHHAQIGRRFSDVVGGGMRKCLEPFASMRIFAPRMRSASDPRQGKDWNLALVGIATFVVSMTSGISNPKTQYAIYAFGWGEDQLALLYTLSSACRFTALMAISPLLSRYIRPLFLQNYSRLTNEGSFRQDPDVPFLSEQEHLLAPSVSYNDLDDTAPDTPSGSAGGVAFDKALISVCFGIEVLGYLAIGANVGASTTLYVVSAAFHSLAAPANPATASLALQVAGPDIDTGLLFGALGIVDGLSSAFLSPILFTSIFTATISWLPSALFIVAAACWSIAFVSIVLVSNPFTSRIQLA